MIFCGIFFKILYSLHDFVDFVLYGLCNDRTYWLVKKISITNMVAYKCPFSSTSCVKIFEFFIIFCWLISLKSSCELLSSLCVHPSFVKFSHFNLPPFPLAYYMTGIRLVTKCYKCCRQIKKYLVWNDKKK